MAEGRPWVQGWQGWEQGPRRKRRSGDKAKHGVKFMEEGLLTDGEIKNEERLW